ncbi:MAG: universal stress protein [Flavobacteriaceae bacterium]
MKKILIALDYHPVSEKVAEAGYRVAKNLNAEACLLHVIADASYYEISYPEFMGYVSVPEVGDSEGKINDMKQTGEDFLKTAAEHFNDPSIKTHLAEGKAKNVILNYAEEWGADMIVMGTHSHNVLKKMILGTVAASVIERSKVPIYLIPVKK